MQDFKNRLVEFARKRYDMGQTRFEEKCGIHPGTISAIKANGPTASVITKIAFACPELNLNWLFRGDGEMLNGAAKESVSHSVNMQNVEAVFITYWTDVREVVEEAVKSTLKNG